MKIRVKSYEREDGVQLIRTTYGDDKWQLRCICGPAWFWDKEKNRWDLPLGYVDRFNFSETDGLDMLKNVKHKK